MARARGPVPVDPSSASGPGERRDAAFVRETGAGPEERPRTAPTLLLTVRSLYPSLTRTERRIADRLLDPEGAAPIVWWSVTECAEQLQVSEATIVRFCQKLGLKGYQELKLTLAQIMGPADASAPVAVDGGEVPAPQRWYLATAERHQRSVTATAQVLSYEAVEAAARALTSAHHIHCYGIGASGFTAMDAAYQCMRVGLFAQAYTDGHLQAQAAANLTRDDVVLGLSVSGSTKDILDSLHIAREAGARVIALTNYRRSPIVQLADVVLLTSCEYGPLEGGSLSAKSGQLLVLDVLITAVMAQLKDAAYQSRQRTARAVLDKLV